MTADTYNIRLQPVWMSGATSNATVLSLCYDFHVGGGVSGTPCSFGSASGDNGRVVKIVNNRDTNRSQNFTYDSLDRISAAYTDGSNWGENFTIDAWANLYAISGYTGKTNHEPLSTTANTSNQLVGYVYDAAGNMTSNGMGTTYAYDGENRLSATLGWTYVYDGDGQRVVKCNHAAPCPTSGLNGTLYFRDMAGNVISEASLGGNVQKEYIFFGGRRVARRDVSTSAVHYYFSDHLGTHGTVTNATGAMPPEQDLDYYPYGGEEQNFSNTSPQNYKFTGKERDTESGLDYFGARYYGSNMGRFMSPDSFGGHLEDPQTLNHYSYVGNNPLSRTDPDGHDFYQQCGSSDHSGCTQVNTDPKNSKSNQWVQAGADGKATIITSDSIRSGQNSATLTQNGLQVNGAQGIYFDNAASHTTDANGTDVNHNSLDVAGSGQLSGFNFHVDGNCGGTCMSAGEWSAPGMSSAQARSALNANSFTIPFEDARAGFGGGEHGYSNQFRFGGSFFGCALSACPNTPHISVAYDPASAYPKYGVPAAGMWHVDAHSGWFAHGQDIQNTH